MGIKPSYALNPTKHTPSALLAIFIFSFYSCVTQKKVEYLQYEEAGIKAFQESEITDYRLKPDDELLIQVSSLDETSVNVFTSSSPQQSLYVGSIQPYGASLISYSVNKDGYVQVPVVGNIFVMGKTLNQVSEMLRDSLLNILSQPVVTVKLVNRFVSVLGEVRNPGHYPYSQERLSIFDAIGLAGDMTEYANRKEIIMVRNDLGTNLQMNLDLTNSKILSSRYYYIRPNDLIYVKPLKNKFWGMRQFPFSIVFSTITTGLLIYNVFR